MADETGGWEFLTGFLLGAVAGAGAALLLAPQSGEVTREQIREQGIELQSRAGDLTETGRKRAKELGAQAWTRAEEAGHRSRLALDKQSSRLQEVIEEGKEAAGKKRDELTTRFETEKAKRPPPTSA
jgi:gas vesicle protein